MESDTMLSERTTKIKKHSNLVRIKNILLSVLEEKIFLYWGTQDYF